LEQLNYKIELDREEVVTDSLIDSGKNSTEAVTDTSLFACERKMTDLEPNPIANREQPVTDHQLTTTNHKQLTPKLSWLKQLKFILPILGGIFLIFVIASLSIGVVDVSIFDFLRGNEDAVNVFVHHRIPRTVAVIVAGVGMSVSGVIMQTITNNKYVSPMTAGTLDAARLGMLLAFMIVPMTSLVVQGIFAFVVTLGLTLLFIFFVERIKVKSSALIPLIGIIYGGVIGSVATLIALQSDQGIQQLVTMLMGSFALTLSGQFEMILIAIPFVVISFIFANWFMLAGMGESASKNLGLNYRLTVMIGLVIVAIISTLVLLVAGMIPFLGLVIPNLVAIYMGDNIKRSLPVTMFVGAIFLLICDILSRVIMFPFEVPISLTVGVIGAVLFLVLLLLKRRKGSA